MNMKDKIIRNCYVIGILMLCIFQFSLYSQATTLSNEILAWGFKRGKNHEQSIFDSASQKVVKDYDGISIGNKEKTIYIFNF